MVQSITLDEINNLFAEVITLDEDSKLMVYDEESFGYIPVTENFSCFIAHIPLYLKTVYQKK